MISKHKNVATFWLAPGFRKFEAYEATTVFQKASDIHPFIAEDMHIIEENDFFYYKPTNPWKYQTQHVQPRKVNMGLNQEMKNPQQHYAIPAVKSTQDEEGISDEALLLGYHRQFRHISFSCLQDMVKLEVILKRLRKYRIPM